MSNNYMKFINKKLSQYNEMLRKFLIIMTYIIIFFFNFFTGFQSVLFRITEQTDHFFVCK